MQRLYKRIIVFLLTLFLFVSCLEYKFPPDKFDYVGEWRGNGVYLHIKGDGRIVYHRKEGLKNVKINSPIKEFKDNKIIVGVWMFTTSFEVNSPPQKREFNKWYMTIDGVELVRYDLEI